MVSKWIHTMETWINHWLYTSQAVSHRDNKFGENEKLYDKLQATGRQISRSYNVKICYGDHWYFDTPDVVNVKFSLG